MVWWSWAPHQVRDALRVELSAGELVVRRAFALMATVRGAAPECVGDGEGAGGGGGDQGGEEARGPAEGVEIGVRRLMEEGEGGKMVRAKAAEGLKNSISPLNKLTNARPHQI
ncbi:hypothetical protein C4D60_Mb04t34930 [Musa balbisiana]|uniref:Uncharacterized protein n=1 Tax=Musa balbisiana TaxID=52838 RepID=A0A4S8KGU7_MUSBA|nr:hypothetical protein C4D60_Mb04t34930 [Musa balbisiana]